MAGRPVYPDRWWLDEQFVHCNRLPITALPLPRQTLTLSEGWRFRLHDQPDEVSTEVFAPAFDDSGWEPVPVPSNWQLTPPGRSDPPIYTNIAYPWPADPPNIGPSNPTGVYRVTVTPAQLTDSLGDGPGSLIVTFDGADSALEVWCNGSFVGASTDSRLEASFDLSPFVSDGPLTLVARVMRWSAGTYLEDQDHWWLSGLHRPVHLWRRPPSHLGDIDVRTPLDISGVEARLRLRITLGGDASGHRVRVRCSMVDGTAVVDRTLDPDGQLVSLDQPMGAIRRWFPEDPYLHRLTVQLLDSDGVSVDRRDLRVGFRDVRINNGMLLVNGAATEIRGVNRHDHDPDNGKVVTPEQMRNELVSMKRHNINAIRTAHYPNARALLDLCDELGMFVVSEANNESHGVWGQLAGDERWASQIGERVRRMVARDRNHPSVIMWSLGNECGWGPVLEHVAATVRHEDPTRPLHYHPADHDPAIDVIAPMYPSVAELDRLSQVGDSRPVIMCEYAHSMGNSTGNLQEYWELIRSRPRLWGGFVWDWKDQALRQGSGEDTWWAYGGDIGDGPHDGDFCINGLVGPDGTPHPALTSLKHVYAPVGISDRGDGRTVEVENRHQFLDLSIYEFSWTVEGPGGEMASGLLDPGIVLAGQRAPTTIPFDRSIAPDQGDLMATVTVRRRRRTRWCDEGHVVAQHQFPLPASRPWAERSRRSPVQRSVPGDLSYELSDQTGGLSSLVVHGNELLRGPMEPWLTRAPTRNDAARFGPEQALAQWREAGYDRLELVVDSLSATATGQRAVACLSCHDTGVAFEITTTVELRSGVLIITNHFEPRAGTPALRPHLARLGHRLRLSDALIALEWYGPGPHETYADRVAGALVGRWQGRIDEQRHPYVVPQESGNHHAVRWASLRTEGGLGIVVFGDAPLDINAGVHDQAAVEQATHHHELAKTDEIHLHVDHRQSGVGNGSCGPGILEAYRVPAVATTWRWAIAPLTGGADPFAVYGAGIPGGATTMTFL